MKIHLNLLLITVLLISSYSTKAQMGINTNKPDTSAVLDIVSTGLDKGLLIPRVSNLADIKKPANSLMVYNTTDSSFYFYRMDKWHEMTPFLKETEQDTIFTKENVNLVITKGNLNLNQGKINTSDDINSDKTITAKTFVGNGITPIGGIIMWSGSTVPDDSWVLCNGGLVTDQESPIVNKPIPDLSGRFIVGAGEEMVNAVGGNTNTVLSEKNMPAHSHEVALMTVETGGHIHPYITHGSGNQDSNFNTGSNNEKGRTNGYEKTYTDVTNSTKKTIGSWSSYNDNSFLEAGNHQHPVVGNTEKAGGTLYTSGGIDYSGSPDEFTNAPSECKDMNEYVWDDVLGKPMPNTNYYKNKQECKNPDYNPNYGQTITVETYTVEPIDNRPKYYVLAFIMRIK